MRKVAHCSLSVVMVLSLLVPSLSTPFIFAAPTAASSLTECDALSDSGCDEEEESPEEKAQREAEERAEEVSGLASSLGVDISTSPVSTFDNPDAPAGAVSINGQTMDIEVAKAAINAIGASYGQLSKGSVDTNTTLKAYANGTALPGQVVGQTSGVIGSPAEVAEAEIKANVGAAAADAAMVKGGITYFANDIGKGVSFDDLLDFADLSKAPKLIDVSAAAKETEFYSGDIFFSSNLVSSDLGGDSQFGAGTLNTFTKITPVQKQMLGEPVTADDWSDPDLQRQASAILASENATLAGKIGRGEALTPEEQAEANSVIGVAINRAAAEGGSVTDYFTNTIYSNWSTESQKRIAELEQNSNYDHGKVGDYYENLFTGQTQTRSFNSLDLQESSPIGKATHYYNPQVATDQTQGTYAVEGTSVQLGQHVFSQQYVADRSRIEYTLQTTGLPEYINVVGVTTASIEEVEAITGSGDFSDEDLYSTVTESTVDNYVKVIELKEEEIINTPVADISVSGGGIILENQNATRNRPPTTELTAQLHFAGKQTGLDFVVTSGGQCAINTCPDDKRVGSTRHDHGDSVDGYFVDVETGRRLDFSNPEDQARAARYIEAAVAAGATGVGGGPNYMNGSGCNCTVHIGGGKPAYWGDDVNGDGSHDGAGAYPWIVEAWSSGIAQQDNFDGTLLTPIPPNNIGDSSGSGSSQTGKDIGSDIGESLCGTLCAVGGGLLGGLFDQDLSGVTPDIKLDEINTDELYENVKTTLIDAACGSFCNSGIGKWFMGMMLRGGGTLPDGPYESIIETDDDNNQNDCLPCPLKTGCENLTHLNYCPQYEGGNEQSGTAIIGFSNAYTSIHTLAKQLVQWAASTSTKTDTGNDIVVETVTVPVTVTINSANGAVELSRQDLISGFRDNIGYYSYGELLRIIGQFKETPLAFADDGNLVYSNGLYAPAMENGEVIKDPRVNYSYIYTVRFIDENGEVVDAGNNSEALPDNLINNLLQAAFNSKTTFGQNQVKSITYFLVDSDRDIKGDEYYDYVITLKSGDTRTITVPEFTSIKYMDERFGSIGYRGNVLDLITIATERAEESGAIGKLLGFVQNIARGTVSRVFTDPKNSDEITTLPDLEGQRTSDILSLAIYTNTDAECSVGEQGFVYSALISDPEDADGGYYITDGRCGDGNTSSIVRESIQHLSSKYGTKETVTDEVLNNTVFVSEYTRYEPKVLRVELSSAAEDQPITLDETPIEEPEGTSTEPLPNLTNDVILEVKAIADNGTVLSDWTTADELNISGGVQLYFRWDGTAYQQCLPFLQDGGNYALTRTNSAMITGDTEAEAYNVPERTGVYRLECGGQRNNEFGVDAREVKVNLN